MKLSSNILSLVLAASTASTAVAEWEWAGTFALDDASHTWFAQKVDGEYVDPAMKIVLYAVDDPSDIDATIHAYEEEAAALIDADDGSCKDINSGDTMDPSDGQACCNLVFDQDSNDSEFPINTDGLKGMVVFGQHVPIEFERDKHYLKDSSGTDIEPVIEEGAEGHAHDHGHSDEGESCACAAKEYGFRIDCSASAAMLDALTFLKNAGCASDCSSKACETSYLIVQAHHDYCPEDKIPQDVEDGFHDYDEQCVACDISRSFVEGAPSCPAASCDSETGNNAYTALLDAGCQTDCSSTECRDLFFTLRVEHDLCPHDTLSRASEEGLHDLEEPCAEQLCNVEGAETSAPVCEDDAHEGHDHGGEDDHSDDHSDDKEAETGSSGAAVLTAAGAIFLGAAMMMA